MDSQALVRSLTAVTRKWTRQRKQEEKDARASQRRRDAMTRCRRIQIQEAAFQVMEEAYLKASGGGKLPAHARQIMYAGRGQVQAMTDRELNDQYFTQQLLPDYITRYPHKTQDWDVIFDARGHFVEPHTHREIPLGTLAVRDYLSGNGRSAYLTDRSDVTDLYPTYGPANRFGAILFIEKEGFIPLLQKVQLAERYDIAIMSTKGMSSTAARRLVDSLCTGKGVPLLIVRDFDKAGFSIAATLQRDTRRYQFRNVLRVHDLGLRLTDVETWNLESESVVYRESDPQDNLRDNGATPDEIAFLTSWNLRGYGGRRVELNAFTSNQFVSWIESKLKEHGVRKIVPDQDVLADAYRRSLKALELRNIIELESARIDNDLKTIPIPEDLSKRLTTRLNQTPGLSWDMALTALLQESRSDS